MNQGASQTFTFAPNAGYSIGAVSVDGSNKGAISTYTFTNVQAAHTISVGVISAASDGNIAPSGTGYGWSMNTTSGANGNRVARAGVNDNNLTTGINLNANGEGGNAMWEAAGVVWSSAKTISAAKFVNGSIDGYGNGYFEANCKLQFTTDGSTWTDSGWTISPAYPNTAAAGGQTYAFSGTAKSGVWSARVVGQTGASSWSWIVNEVQLIGH